MLQFSAVRDSVTSLLGHFVFIINRAQFETWLTIWNRFAFCCVFAKLFAEEFELCHFLSTVHIMRPSNLTVLRQCGGSGRYEIARSRCEIFSSRPNTNFTLFKYCTSDFQRRTLDGWTLKMAMAQPKVSQSTGGFCLSSRIYMWYYPDPQNYRFPLTYLKDSSCGRCYAQQTVWLSVILYTHLHVLSPQDSPPVHAPHDHQPPIQGVQIRTCP